MTGHAVRLPRLIVHPVHLDLMFTAQYIINRLRKRCITTQLIL